MPCILLHEYWHSEEGFLSDKFSVVAQRHGRQFFSNFQLLPREALVETCPSATCWLAWLAACHLDSGQFSSPMLFPPKLFCRDGDAGVVAYAPSNPRHLIYLWLVTEFTRHGSWPKCAPIHAWRLTCTWDFFSTSAQTWFAQHHMGF